MNTQALRWIAPSGAAVFKPKELAVETVEEAAMLASREALILAQELVAEMLQADEASWRRRWLAAMASLRTAYDVLVKVDKQDPLQRAHIDPVLARRVDGARKEPPILFAFIKDVSNGLLHQFRFDVDADLPLLLGRDGQPIWGRSSEGVAPIRLRPVFTLTAGPLKGQEGRALLSEACRWSDGLLFEIEGSLAQGGAPPSAPTE